MAEISFPASGLFIDCWPKMFLVIEVDYEELLSAVFARFALKEKEKDETNRENKCEKSKDKKEKDKKKKYEEKENDEM